jgi:hypothetical protein
LGDDELRKLVADAAERVRRSRGWRWYVGECNASPVSEMDTFWALPIPSVRCKRGDARMNLIFAAVLAEKSIS